VTTRRYWGERSYADSINPKGTYDILSEASKLYDSVSQSLKKEAEAFFGRYTVNNYSDLDKSLRQDELKSFRQELKRYYDRIEELKKANDNVLTKQILQKYAKELRTLSGRANLSRLNEIQANFKYQAVNLGVEEQKLFESGLSKTAEQGYMQASYEIDKERGFTNGLSPVQTDKLLNSRWLGENYSDRIWKSKDNLVRQLDTTFMQGVAMGHNPVKIAKELSERLGVSYKSCERLARTEVIHMMNDATAQSYKDHGVTQYQFLVDLSERTCPICGALDGQVFNVSDKEEGVNYPVLHPNCRCTTVPYFEEDDIDRMFEQSSRVAYDENHSIYQVPSNATYNEWKAIVDAQKASQNIPKGAIKSSEFVATGWRTDNQNQPDKCNTLQGLYKYAEEARHEFSSNTEFMAKMYENLNPVVMKRDKLKSEERIKEKLRADQEDIDKKGLNVSAVYDKKTNTYYTATIRDIDGHTVAVRTVDDLQKLFKGYEVNPYVIRIKNNFAKGSATGYKDINMNLRMSNGVIVEVQLNTVANVVAKENYGHALYEVYRSVALNSQYSQLKEYMDSAQASLYGLSNKLSENGGFPNIDGSKVFGYTYEPYSNAIKEQVKNSIPYFEEAKNNDMFDKKTVEHYEALVKKLGL